MHRDRVMPVPLDRQHGGALAVVFAMIFIVIGLGIGVFFAKGLVDWIAAKSWAPVPARVLSVDLDRQRDSDGNSTYRVVAEYEYRWRGERRTGTRVDLHPGADNLGDYHQQLHQRLERAMRAGEPVTAWVDPDDPSQAVLERGMRWGRFAVGMLFPLLFGGFGIGLLWMARRGARRAREREARRSADPARPWLWSGRWTSTRLPGDTGSTACIAAGFALFWNLLSLPVLLIVPGELEQGNWPALLGLLFPLIGIGLIVWAVRAWIRRRRYGPSTLVLDSLPAPLGGSLRATLHVPARLEGRELDVHCACLHRYRTGTGKSRRTAERTLWEDEEKVMLRSGSGPGQTSARIEMRLPGDRPEASDEDPNNRIVWRLEVGSEEPGVDYKAVFDLPVFAVGEANAASAVPAATVEGPAPHDRDDWVNSGVEHGHVAGGQRFYFPRLRLAGAGLGALLFALIFTGIGVAVGVGAGHWIFGGVFALVGLLILWGAITMLFSRSEMVVGGGKLRWRHGVFGGWRETDAGAIKTIDVQRSGSIGRKLYFRIEIERYGEAGKAAIAGWVPNERAARSLAGHLGRLLGIDPPPPA